MTTETTKTTKTTKKPDYIAYHVRDGKGDKGYFTRVGVAFAHKDGKGFNILLDMIPLDGRVALRVPSEKVE